MLYNPTRILAQDGWSNRMLGVIVHPKNQKMKKKKRKKGSKQTKTIVTTVPYASIMYTFIILMDVEITMHQKLFKLNTGLMHEDVF